MTPEEARLLLDANTLRENAADEELRTAEALLRDDEALAAWAADRKAFDNRVAAALAEVPVPEGLRERLLAAAQPVKPVRRFIAGPWLALAAAIAISAGWFAWSLTQAGPTPDAWMKEALVVMNRIEGDPPKILELLSPDLKTLESKLKNDSAPLPFGLPKNLLASNTIGCKTFMVDGKRATIICFMIEPGVVAHLTVFEGGLPARELSKNQPLFAENGDWKTASWSDGGRGYMLATHGPSEKLRHLFG